METLQIFDELFFQQYPKIDFQNAKIEPFGEGLINFSWVVSLPNSPQKYFLQQLNTTVFSRVDILENNLEISENFLQNSDFSLIFPLRNISGKMHTYYKNSVFRLYHFLENTDTYQIPLTKEYIFSAAKKFAKFSCVLTPIASSLQETIPDFHNLTKRYEEFQKIIQNIHSERRHFAKNEITKIEKMAWIVEKFEEYKKILPKRVFHHDAKMNNILFANNSSEALFPVDLDTIMPGYIFSDFGDMVWSMVFGIDHNRPEKTYFDVEKYQFLVDGYVGGFENSLSENEIHAMHFGGIVMSYMLAIRFLSDFLHGDKYFKIQYEYHNYDRAFFQIDIVKQLVEYANDHFLYFP